MRKLNQSSIDPCLKSHFLSIVHFLSKMEKHIPDLQIIKCSSFALEDIGYNFVINENEDCRTTELYLGKCIIQLFGVRITTFSPSTTFYSVGCCRCSVFMSNQGAVRRYADNAVLALLSYYTLHKCVH